MDIPDALGQLAARIRKLESSPKTQRLEQISDPDSDKAFDQQEFNVIFNFHSRWDGGLDSNFGNFVICNTDALLGAVLQLQSKNSIPANNDLAGLIRTFAKNSNGDDTIFSDIYFVASDITDGAETGKIIFIVQEAGVDKWPLTLWGSKVGIDEQNPSEALHISGNLRVTGDIFSTARASYAGSSTFIGWSSRTTTVLDYKIVGKLLYVWFYIEGTSDSVDTSFTLPVSGTGNWIIHTLRTQNDGSFNIGFLLEPAGLTVSFYPDAAGSPWVNHGAKGIYGSAVFTIG